MNNCKTCMYRLFDPLWTVYKCRLKMVEIQDVDTLDCEEYKKGNPANYVAPKEPKPVPSKPIKPTITPNGPGNCTTCIHGIYDPLWTVYKCKLKDIEIQNGESIDCEEYTKGKPTRYTKPTEPKLGPPMSKNVKDNGIFKASDDGVIGYSEVIVDVPTEVLTHPSYEGPTRVKPKTEEQTLPTKNRAMTDDVKVLAIPYYETSNTQNGTTVIIGD